jgi:metal-responsive CopG/Arc/MetJ family transcriptional regulator
VTRKVLVSLDTRLLDRIDRAARERGLSRSALISELAARALGVRTPGEQQRIARAQRDLVRLFMRNGTGVDPAKAVREERDQRLERLSR